MGLDLVDMNFEAIMQLESERQNDFVDVAKTFFCGLLQKGSLSSRFLFKSRHLVMSKVIDLNDDLRSVSQRRDPTGIVN